MCFGPHGECESTSTPIENSRALSTRKRQLSFFKPKFTRRRLSSQAKVQLGIWWSTCRETTDVWSWKFIHSFIHINLNPLQDNVKVKQYIFSGMLHLMKNYYYINNSNNNIIIAKYNIISKIIMSALSILLMALALNHRVCMTVDCRLLAH